MSEDDLTFVAASILLAQTIGGVDREATSTEVDQAVANAEKLREAIDKRRRSRHDRGVHGVVESLKKQEGQ